MEGSMAKRVSACGARAQAIGKQKVSYASLFWLFLIGSVTGFVLEGLWCIVRKGHWESRTATVWGPFCVIYGVGAVAVDLLAVLLRGRHPVQQFLAFSASGAAVEYFGSLFQERCFGTFSWDYSQDFLNLGGRVSLQTALVWGALGLLFVWLAFPGISRLLQRMRGRAWRGGLRGAVGLPGGRPSGHLRGARPLAQEGGRRGAGRQPRRSLDRRLLWR